MSHSGHCVRKVNYSWGTETHRAHWRSQNQALVKVQDKCTHNVRSMLKLVFFFQSYYLYDFKFSVCSQRAAE